MATHDQEVRAWQNQYPWIIADRLGSTGQTDIYIVVKEHMRCWKVCGLKGMGTFFFHLIPTEASD
jgi:hypothetical protein